jgi:hypothetical protein
MEVKLTVSGQAFEVFANNRDAIDLAHSKTSQNVFRTKHMSIRLHFTREIIVTGLIALKYIKSNVSLGLLCDNRAQDMGAQIYISREDEEKKGRA